MTNYFEVKTWHDRFRLACFECGETEEYPSTDFEQLKKLVVTRTGFDPRVATVEIRGKCRRCKAGLPPSPSGQPNHTVH